MSKGSDAVKQWRIKSKLRIVTALGGSCVVCGYNRCLAAFDIHHKVPAIKEFSFSAVRTSPATWEKVCKELRSCVLLCANCHREVHAGITTIPNNAKVFDEQFADYQAAERLSRLNACPVCGELKHISMKTCSPLCAAKTREVASWETIDLLEVSKTTSNCAIARQLGVSEAAVRKRLKKMAARAGFEPAVGINQAR
jgi:hypothetical protein